MKAAFVQLLRSRWFVTCAHVGLWLLLYLALKGGMNGKSPELREADGTLPRPGSPAPVTRLNRLFGAVEWPDLSPATNAMNAFFTRHFIPPPAPPPPAPTTRMIELTYLGFYETDGAAKTVIVKLADAFLITPLGAKLTANLFASHASMQNLTLTNSAAQTNILVLNTKKQLEVPIQ
jgi:hypothetical protein